MCLALNFMRDVKKKKKEKFSGTKIGDSDSLLHETDQLILGQISKRREETLALRKFLENLDVCLPNKQSNS